jgi:hypothetical protein
MGDYLSAAGRLPGIRPEDYLFAPLAIPFQMSSALRPEDWVPARPISRNNFVRVLRIYAGCAELRPELISPRALRYSAVILRIEAGDTPEELAAFLGRSDPKRVELDVWRLVEEDPPDLLQDGALGPPTRPNRVRGAPPGCLIGLEHGLYASHLPAEDFEGVDELPGESLAEEIRVLRVVIGRTLARLDDSLTLEQSLHFLKIMAYTTGRLARVMKT